MNATENVNVAKELVNDLQIENSKKLTEKLNAKKNSKKDKTENKKVSASSEKKNSKVEKIEKVKNLSFNALLSELNVSGLKSSAGLRKENLYNNSIYADCITDKDKKSVRRKIRSLLDNFIGSIIRTESQKEICKNHIKQFIVFYENVYRVNDFSISSLISNNTDNLKKQNLQRMLDIVKKYNK